MDSLEDVKKDLMNYVKKSVDVDFRIRGYEPVKPVRAQGARISSRYGKRDPLPYHYGIDITAGGDDVKIYAAYSGTVEFVGIWPGMTIKDKWGYYIIINGNNGLYHVYAHLKEGSAVVRVDQEEPVKAGDELGIMGNTGFSQGKHLHFELLKRYDGNGKILNESKDTCPEPVEVENLYNKK